MSTSPISTGVFLTRAAGEGVDAARREYTIAVLGAAAATAVAAAAERWLGLADLSMVFMLAVLAVATRTRLGPAVLAAVLCFLSYNFFFIEPRLSFAIGARQGVATVLMFLGAALLAGRLASRLRTQLLTLGATHAQALALQTLGRQLAAAGDELQIAAAARDSLREALGVEVWLRLGDDEFVTPDAAPASAEDRTAADWSQAHGQPAGRFTRLHNRGSWWFLPLPGTPRLRGVLGLRFPDPARPIRPDQQALAEAMADDIAQAALRTRLASELESARLSSETERLRSALLSSVSHDLRSPLAAIIGAASSLENYGAAMTAEDRASLLETVRLEGERLDRYIQNLLDMTRLGHGELAIRRDWIGVAELVGAAVGRLRRYQPQSLFLLDVPSELPPIWVHPALLEQALFNVLENAAKFSPAGEAVTVTAGLADGALRIDISDLGPGIPEDERKRIFDMFYSVERGDRGRQGTGLGLTICQGMVGAHGGSVEALPGANSRGTTIRLQLPLLQPPPRS